MFQTGEINTGSFEGGGALKTIDLSMGEVTTLIEVPDGMRNRDVREHLFGQTTDRDLRRRQADKVSRLFRRLQAHGLVAKIPRSRRWRLTQRKTLLISVFLTCHYEKHSELFAHLAA